MTEPNCSILYVTNPLASADFYSSLLARQPVEASPGFAMFVLDSGVMLGLWAAADVKPAATRAGGSEIGFSVAGNETVSRLHREWSANGLTIVQEPVAMDFGYTFVALDPDGHRLRVFAPGQPG